VAATIDYDALLAPDLPPPAPRWNGFPPYNFIGGNVDAASMPVEDMISATAAALRREGTTLATYGLESGPLGYRPLREFGGWGIRPRGGKTAWTIRGNQAVKVTLHGGKEVYVGSLFPQRLEERIRTAMRAATAK
jgi:hypothetical protein